MICDRCNQDKDERRKRIEGIDGLFCKSCFITQTSDSMVRIHDLYLDSIIRKLESIKFREGSLGEAFHNQEIDYLKQELYLARADKEKLSNSNDNQTTLEFRWSKGQHIGRE